MKRRIVLVAIVGAVLACVVGGVWWYVRRNTGARLLARAELAMMAEKFDRALSLAEDYAAKHPTDWRGPYTKARVLIRLGRYEDARAALADAGRLGPSEVSVPLLLAETYALPARRLLIRRDALGMAELDEAVKLLEKATETLSKIQPGGPKRAVDVEESLGLNCRDLAVAWDRSSSRQEGDARTAELAGKVEEAAALREKSAEHRAKGQQAVKQAIKWLGEVVGKEPSRSNAGMALVALGIQDGDEKALAAAEKAFETLASPPAEPAAALALHRLRWQRDVPLGRKRSGKPYALLARLSEEHPKDWSIRLDYADAADMLGEHEKAEKVCREAIEENSRNPRARLLLGRALLGQRRFAEAEDTLLNLLVDLREQSIRWPEAHLHYARAAFLVGKDDSARGALRAVTEMTRAAGATWGPAAEASRLLAESLMRDGHYKQAFADARAYYDARPADPAAIALFVRAARHTDQLQLATETLKKAETDQASNPRVLLAVAQEYGLIGQAEQFKQVLEKAAACEGATFSDRLAVVEAMVVLGRTAEAEKVLTTEFDRDKDYAPVRRVLGRLYARTGRLLQAAEQFRAAVDLDPDDPACRLELAQTLFAAGDYDECEHLVNGIDPRNPEAKALRLDLRLARGETLAAEEAIQMAEGTRRSGQSLAEAFLNSGRLAECVQVCQDELKKTPGDSRLNWLLGWAHRRMGQSEECTRQWSLVLTARPGDLSVYLALCGALAERLDPEGVRKTLAETSGAKPELIDLAMGWLFLQMRKFPEAADACRAVIDRQGIDGFVQHRARVLCASALAASGKPDEGLVELEAVAKDPAWRERAMQVKAELLVAVGRREQAAAALADLRKLAGESMHAPALARAARMYAGLGKTQEALEICDQMASLFPRDPQPHRLRAEILGGAGRGGEALASLQTVVSLQPGDFASQLLLARALDAEGLWPEALHVLRQLDGRGETGRVVALFEEGVLLAGWGLHARSRSCFEKLASDENTRTPGLQIRLARALVALGERDQAREVLGRIPAHSPAYVPAQLLLAGIAGGAEEALGVLGRLEKARPGDAGVLAQKLVTYLNAGRASEAVTTFQALAARVPKGQLLPAEVTLLGVRAMLEAKDQAGAAELADRTATATAAPQWRRLAVLLNMDGKPDLAAKLLPAVEKADPYDCMLGAALAARKDDMASAGKWADRIDEALRSSGEAAKQVHFPHALLVDLTARRLSQAKERLAGFKGRGFIMRHAAAELVASAGDGARASAEAAKLLKVSSAVNLRLLLLARSLAMQVLQARPACQWAAALALEAQPDAAALKELLKVLQPGDCVLGHTIRASLLSSQGEYLAAAQSYRKAAELEKQNPVLVLNEAMCLEKAGQLEAALTMYRAVWKDTKEPVAGNNAAYLTSELHREDSARLEEALTWVEEAIKAQPGAPAFRDTKAWLAFLLGRKAEAVKESRRAVKGHPNSVEVHFHTGLIELDAGTPELGRWHLEAALSLAQASRADGRQLSSVELKAESQAKEALSKAGAKPK